MCTTCGCGSSEARVEGAIVDGTGEHGNEHRHEDGTVHTHWHRHEGGRAHAPAGVTHAHQHVEGTWHSHVHGGGSAHVPPGAAPLGAAHEAGMPTERIVRIEQDILARNNAFAGQNRQA